MNNLKPGMVVKLKSGGPEMTIVELSNLGIICEWFLVEGKVQRHSFKPEVLEEVKKK
jgi:uncharacterized protein YodC (DUF2158 family)